MSKLNENLQIIETSNTDNKIEDAIVNFILNQIEKGDFFGN